MIDDFDLALTENHDRARELRQLSEAWDASDPELITVWGRRRVGKSTLLGHFARDKRAIYLHGTRVARSEILVSFSLQVVDVFDDDRL